MLLRLLLLVGPSVVACSEVAVATCTPPPAVPPCETCTAADRDRAVAKCHLGVEHSVRLETSAAGDRVVVFDEAAQNGRFGNKLGAFYSAAALAGLSAFPLEPAVLVYDDIHLNFSLPTPEPANFSAAPLLELYCARCPLSHGYPTLCPGLWLLADVRGHLQRSFRHRLDRYDADAVIQFRCGDSHADRMMGMLPFEYYHAALAGRVNRSSHVTLLPDPEAATSECCMGLAFTLSAALYAAFRCGVTVLQPTTVGRDFARLMHAPLLVGGPSTFALYAAIATSGEAFLPVSWTLLGNATPCLPHVTWVRTPRVTHGCSTSVFDWFVNKSTSPETYQYLRELLTGPWFSSALHNFVHRHKLAVMHSKTFQKVVNQPHVKRIIEKTRGSP